jgi:hypothetical protein
MSRNISYGTRISYQFTSWRNQQKNSPGHLYVRGSGVVKVVNARHVTAFVYLGCSRKQSFVMRVEVTAVSPQDGQSP